MKKMMVGGWYKFYAYVSLEVDVSDEEAQIWEADGLERDEAFVEAARDKAIDRVWATIAGESGIGWDGIEHDFQIEEAE